MRNGIIQLLGYVVAKGYPKERQSKEEEEDEEELTRDSLLDILTERFADVSSFVRGKVIQTWQYLYEYYIFYFRLI